MLGDLILISLFQIIGSRKFYPRLQRIGNKSRTCNYIWKAALNNLGSDACLDPATKSWLNELEQVWDISCWKYIGGHDQTTSKLPYSSESLWDSLTL